MLSSFCSAAVSGPPLPWIGFAGCRPLPGSSSDLVLKNRVAGLSGFRPFPGSFLSVRSLNRLVHSTRFSQFRLFHVFFGRPLPVRFGCSVVPPVSLLLIRFPDLLSGCVVRFGLLRSICLSRVYIECPDHAVLDPLRLSAASSDRRLSAGLCSSPAAAAAGFGVLCSAHPGEGVQWAHDITRSD